MSSRVAIEPFTLRYLSFTLSAISHDHPYSLQPPGLDGLRGFILTQNKIPGSDFFLSAKEQQQQEQQFCFAEQLT